MHNTIGWKHNHVAILDVAMAAFSSGSADACKAGDVNREVVVEAHL